MKHIKRLTGFLLIFVVSSGCTAPRGNDFDAPSTPPFVTSSPDVSLAPTATPAPSQTPLPSPQPSAPDVPEAAPAMSVEPEKLGPIDGFFYMELSDALKKRITGMSYPSDDGDAKIHYDDLRYIGLLYHDFEGNVKTGELIVNKKLADEVMQMFYELYCAKYPFTSIRLVDDFGEPADDTRSMEANNTSAFNYRRITGSKKLSLHGYGMAIDINPKLNPYVKKNGVSPENGKAYVDRSKDFAGKIDHDDLCYKLFIKNGWKWGGDWKTVKDYQHFEKDVR